MSRDVVVARTLVCASPVPVDPGRETDVGRGRVRFVADVRDGSLAGSDRLAVTVRNRSPVRVLVEVVLTGSGPAEGAGGVRLFSGGRDEVAPGDERELLFPLEAFGSYSRARDWRYVDRAEVIVKREKADDGDAPLAVEPGAVFAERRRVPAGPRLTAGGLARVSRKEEAPPPPRPAADISLAMPCPHFFPEDRAGDVLAGLVMGRRLERPLPWDCGFEGAHEWAHFLHRHHFLRPVLRAYVETGEGRYSAFLQEVVCDWIVRNPVPLDSNGGAGSAWETLTAAWRLREWLALWQVDETAPFLCDAARRLLLRSLWEHCRHLTDHRGHPTNWIILESGALALAGARLTRFRESPLWLQEGVGRLRPAVRRQFLPDGAHDELSPFYHAHCLFVLLEVRRVLASIGVVAPPELEAPLTRAAEYLAALRRPDGSWPSLNDSGGVAADYSAVLRLAGAPAGGDHPPAACSGGHAAAASPGARGGDGRRRARIFGCAGVAVLRAGRDPDRSHVVFRAGPPGVSHGHDDVLSLDATLGGVLCLVDPGISAYAPGPLTKLARSAGAHGMVLVDGQGPPRDLPAWAQQRRQDGRTALSFAPGEGCAVLGACRYGGESPASSVVVTRHVALSDARALSVHDTVSGQGIHRVTVCWQFAPGRLERVSQTGAVYVADAGTRVSLAVRTASHASPEVRHFHGDRKLPLGWVSLRGRDVPAPHMRYEVEVVLPFELRWEMAAQT